MLLCTAAAEKMNEDLPEMILAGMTLREKAAQMIIASFRTWKELPENKDGSQEEPPAVKITELNDEIRAMLTRDRFGGILLFGKNFADAEQTLHFIADMQTANQAGGQTACQHPGTV